MGLFDFLKSKLPVPSQFPPRLPVQSMPQELSAFDIELAEHDAAEKKEAASKKPEPEPRKITNKDMQQFEMLPFTFSEPIKCQADARQQYTEDLSPDDEFTVIRELSKLDNFIRYSPQYCPIIPFDINIMIDCLVFEKKKTDKGFLLPYTHLICNPYTSTGKLSKHPVAISFVTPYSSFIEWTTGPNGPTGITRTNDHASGTVWYSRDGEISKAKVSIWKNYEGYFYDFKTVGKTFYLHKIRSTVKRDAHDLPDVIYKMDI